ncbi:MAG TPA: TonB-dependent receptor, partial [Pyrinomonadaceae bacterium]|nr:TonB-dependent receptor [Pyrinomonadaceae bacterium]
MLRPHPGFLSLCALFCVLAAAVTFGQDLDDVTIRGSVVDQNGLAIPGASVTLTETGTSTIRTAVADNGGSFTMLKIPPGTYSLIVASPGFGSVERELGDLSAGRELAMEFQLSPAPVTAETEVTVDSSDIPDVDTTRIVVGSTVESLEIEELPNLDRNPLDLVLTVGGVSEEALSTTDLAEDSNANPRSTPFEQGNFSISGGASYSNNITIDGMDNNDDRSARERFQPSLEAVAEVQVVRSQFSSEYGRASGGRVNMRTRGGTKRLRGRAFLFYRDDVFNANSWYNNSRGIERPSLTAYTPGFTLGGPLNLPILRLKNRTFFFAAYENQRLDDTTLIDTYIPVTPNPRFNLPVPSGGAEYCDQAGGGPPPCNAEAGTIAHFTQQFATPNSGHIFSARFDHKLTERNSFTIGWQLGRRTNRRTLGFATTRLEEALQAKNVETDAVNFTNDHAFSARAVNQFRFQWSSYRPSYETDNPGAPVVLIGYRNPVTNGTQTLIAGNSSSSNLQYFADRRDETRYQIQNSVTILAGGHTIKAGADIQSVDSRANALGDGTGTFNFSNAYNYSTNNVTRFRQNFGTSSDVTNTYLGFFINDQIRVRPNLNISLGLRYERETAVDDNDNFGPRFGVAWDPRGKGEDVIRFGAGIFYNRVLLRTVGDFIQNSGTGLEEFDTNSIPTTTGVGTLNPRSQILAAISDRFPSGFGSAVDLRAFIATVNCGPVNAPVACSPDFGFVRFTGSGGNPLRSIEPGLEIPESYQFNIGYEREIGKRWVFEANYTWNKTVHLWREYNINMPVLPTGYADFTQYLLANSFTFTNVNGNVRTYNFYLGPTNDPSGVSTNPNTQTGSCSTVNTVTCWVNLNSYSTSLIRPNSNAGDGVSSNSVGSPIGIARAALQHLRPDPSVDEMARVASLGNAFYQGLVLEVRRRYRAIGKGFGLSMRAAYTLSRTMDDGLNNTSNAEINTDFDREWARARQDRLHRFALSGMIDTPQWLGNLRFSPIFRYGSASRFNLGYGVDR